MSYFGSNNAFGIVTVMDAEVYKFVDPADLLGEMQVSISVQDYLDHFTGANAPKALATIKHLQVATLSTEGPSLEISGGKFNNKLIKYGKTARCEMTDALGQANVLVALGGAEMDGAGNISITDKFGAPVTIIGDTFVVDQKTGKHIPMKVILYQFLPDSTPSFAFDSGNAATFDLNGDLLAVEHVVTNADEGSEGSDGWEECGGASGLFFSFVPYGCALPREGSEGSEGSN